MCDVSVLLPTKKFKRKICFVLGCPFPMGDIIRGSKQFGSVAFSRRNKPLHLKWIKFRFKTKLKFKRRERNKLI